MAIVPQDQSLHKLQQNLDGVDARVGQPKAHYWAWVLGRQARWSHWGHLPLVQRWSRLPNMHALRVASSSAVVKCGGPLSRVQGPALLLQWATRGKASFLRAVKEGTGSV